MLWRGRPQSQIPDESLMDSYVFALWRGGQQANLINPWINGNPAMICSAGQGATAFSLNCSLIDLWFCLLFAPEQQTTIIARQKQKFQPELGHIFSSPGKSPQANSQGSCQSCANWLTAGGCQFSKPRKEAASSLHSLLGLGLAPKNFCLMPGFVVDPVQLEYWEPSPLRHLFKTYPPSVFLLHWKDVGPKVSHTEPWLFSKRDETKEIAVSIIEQDGVSLLGFQLYESGNLKYVRKGLNPWKPRGLHSEPSDCPGNMVQFWFLTAAANYLVEADVHG